MHVNMHATGKYMYLLTITQNKKTKKKTALYVLLNDILRFKDLEEFYQLQHHSFQKRY
jgi:hypothetical protein